MQFSESFHSTTGDYAHALQDEAAGLRLSPEEIQARLDRNALFLSEENARVWSALLAQEWFEDVRELSAHSPSVAQWIAAIERIAQGRAGAADVKQAVFYRSAFRQAQSQASAQRSDVIGHSLMRLSRYLTAKLKPQHNHFG